MLRQNNKFGNLFMMVAVSFEVLIPHSVRITQPPKIYRNQTRRCKTETEALEASEHSQ